MWPQAFKTWRMSLSLTSTRRPYSRASILGTIARMAHSEVSLQPRRSRAVERLCSARDAILDALIHICSVISPVDSAASFEQFPVMHPIPLYVSDSDISLVSSMRPKYIFSVLYCFIGVCKAIAKVIRICHTCQNGELSQVL